MGAGNELRREHRTRSLLLVGTVVQPKVRRLLHSHKPVALEPPPIFHVMRRVDQMHNKSDK